MAPEEDQELLQKAEPLISATVASSLERSSDPISPHCHPDANGVDATTPLPSPIQGKSDWRNYSSVRLPNGVVVCAASDPQSKTTAASATVRAGAAHDPREMPGLAHFLEHMCFLGSAKYPGENDYKKFLSQHGGQSNASTSLFVTNYKFEVLADFADTALDMFSQFFVDPLLTESGTKREVNAVDSENSKNLTADARRRLQILKDVCDREHYFTKFTTGNLSTLLTSRRRLLRDQQQNAPAGDDAPERNEEEEEEDVKVLRQALLCFHATHYRPDRLTVTVVGPQSTDQLLGMVVPRFAPMRPRAIDATAETIDRVIRQWIDDAAQDPPPFGYAPWQSPPAAAVPFRSPLFASALGSLLVTKPVTSQRRLVLLFPLPRYCQPPDGVDSDRSPIHLISHLLGHEGELTRSASFCLGFTFCRSVDISSCCCWWVLL
jgi:insulysin